MSSSVKRSLQASKSHKTLGRSNNGNAAAVDPLDPSQLDVTVVGWTNIEQKFNELKGLLSAPAAGLNANQARAAQKQNVSAAIVQLLDRAQQDCRRLLIEGNAKAAVEGGLKTLRLKEAYYGHGHLQLVPAYFHLARTNQYMDRFKAAEEFLSLAQWTILRNKDVDVSLKAELHQTFGLLYASDSKLDAALKQLTCATYYLCVMNGPEHILTSFGYFDLGNVFAAKSNMDHAMAFYDRVKDIWYNHLTTALKKALEPAASEAAVYGIDPTDSSNSHGDDVYVAANFGLENLQDAVKMLRGIVGLQTERYGRVHPSTARAEYVLGMFMLWNGDSVSAVSSLLKALEISKRVYGDRHPNTGEIRSLLLNFHLEVPEDTAYVLEDGFEPAAPAAAAPAPHRVPTPPQHPRTPTPPKQQEEVEDAQPSTAAVEDAKQDDGDVAQELEAESNPAAPADDAVQGEEQEGGATVEEGDAAEEGAPAEDGAAIAADDGVAAEEGGVAEEGVAVEENGAVAEESGAEEPTGATATDNADAAAQDRAETEQTAEAAETALPHEEENADSSIPAPTE